MFVTYGNQKFYNLKKNKMNFCDKMAIRFRKQGMSKNEIIIRFRRYYLFSKAMFVLYLLAIVLFAILKRFKTGDSFVLVLFFIWFVLCFMMFSQLRKYIKANHES